MTNLVRGIFCKSFVKFLLRLALLLLRWPLSMNLLLSPPLQQSCFTTPIYSHKPMQWKLSTARGALREVFDSPNGPITNCYNTIGVPDETLRVCSYVLYSCYITNTPYSRNDAQFVTALLREWRTKDCIGSQPLDFSTRDYYLYPSPFLSSFREQKL